MPFLVDPPRSTRRTREAELATLGGSSLPLVVHREDRARAARSASIQCAYEPALTVNLCAGHRRALQCRGNP